MERVSTYLNFERETEAAFDLYKSVFGGEFTTFMRYGDAPGSDGSDPNKDLIVNVQLPILGGHVLMGTDVPKGSGFDVVQGNNSYICLHPATRAESDRIYAALTEGGNIENALAEMFWGDYWGSWSDKFGIRWMINCSSKE